MSLTPLGLVAALLALGGGAAHAGAPDGALVRPVDLAACGALPPEPDPAERGERHLAHLRRAGLDVTGPLSLRELCALSAGLGALPPALARVPRGRVRLRFDESMPATASGMREPEWDGDDFVLTPQAGFVGFRDEALGADERRLLWRARATVHAVLARWDEAERWSQAPTWRRVNGWVLPFERPTALREFALNSAHTAYARPRGQASARLDFLTFAEAALVPVTALPVDDQLRCQEFTKHRALAQLFGATWEPGPCPAFDAWHRADELDALEVLMVQASGRAAESLFGHLLVRPVWRSSIGPTFESVIQFAAITLPRSGPVHLVRGTFGGYWLGVFTISLTDLLREKLSGEQRGLTRWRLNLTAREQRRFLERTWELERRGRFAYHFFSDNCATVLVWLLEASLEEPHLVSWPGFITAPADVLDSLFRARRASGERLLAQAFPSWESTSAVARRDEAARRRLERRMGVDWAGVHGPDVDRRRAAYRAAAAFSRGAPAAHHEDLFRWWALSARIERAQADEALHAWRELEDERMPPGSVDLDAVWRERLSNLERESALQQQLMLLDREAFADELRRRAKKRPMTRGEAAEDAERRAKLALFDEVTALQGELVAEVLQGGDALAFLASDGDAAVAEEVTHAARHLTTSGHWRLGVGAGAWRQVDGALAPVVRIEEAGLLEWLGEQRLRGLGAATGTRILEGAVTLSPTRGSPVVASHFTLIGFDSLSPSTPPAARWRDHLGFGFDVATDFRAWRSIPSVSGAVGWVLLGARADKARQLVTLGVGPVAWAGVDAAGVAPLGGVSGRLVARVTLGEGWPSALRAEVRHASVWGPGRQLHELRADVAFEWVLGWRGHLRLVLRPTLAVSAEPALGRVDALGLVMLEPVESLAALLR